LESGNQHEVRRSLLWTSVTEVIDAVLRKFDTGIKVNQLAQDHVPGQQRILAWRSMERQNSIVSPFE
jgi:hypothetical protein